MTPVPVLRIKLSTIALVQVSVTLVLTGAITALWGVQPGASFGSGMAVMLANSLLLVWIWSRILAKKSFALTIAIIVVKYTVLLTAIFILTREPWFHVLGAGLGMAAFILSTLIQVGLAKWE